MRQHAIPCVRCVDFLVATSFIQIYLFQSQPYKAPPQRPSAYGPREQQCNISQLELRKCLSGYTHLYNLFCLSAPPFCCPKFPAFYASDFFFCHLSSAYLFLGCPSYRWQVFPPVSVTFRTLLFVLSNPWLEERTRVGHQHTSTIQEERYEPERRQKWSCLRSDLSSGPA